MMETIADKFLGTWDLVSWTIETSDGKVESPFGDDVSGQITYESNGIMSVLIMKNDRLPFRSPDPLEGSPEEVLSAWNGFIAYCGSYELNGDLNVVIHQIKISSFPNWVGQNQVRRFNFNEDLLTLSTDFIGSRKHKLIWNRITTHRDSRH